MNPHALDLSARAARVLADNDTGTLITASPALYPHMWSWDTAFITVGLAHIDVPRAIQEFTTLLAAQWDNGMLPHTVFTDATGYFPGPDRWWDTTNACPVPVPTSAICAPPVHAITLRRIVACAGGQAAIFARRAWDALYRWHHWLATQRLSDSGLISIVQSWTAAVALDWLHT